MEEYKKESLSLIGAVSMGTGVMIGAGIFALTGEVALLAGHYFILAFIGAGMVAACTSYSYIKMSNAYPSSGGIGMILKKCYGEQAVTGWGAILMFFSMVINQSLVARSFGNYLSQVDVFGISQGVVPWIGLGLVAFSFLVNILSNKYIERFSFIMAVFKIVGLILLSIGGFTASGVNFERLISPEKASFDLMGFLGAVALGVLAFKGFTTITNSGAEIKKPHKNIGRAIGISLGVCLAVYILVTMAVGSSLSLSEIIESKNYALAQAARPTYGNWGVNLTVGLAIIACVSGIIASMFAVSRMLAMLSEMKLVPHRHFGMPGTIQKHTLVYTAVLAGLLNLLFDVSRIAAIGAFLYITMDILIQYGVLSRMNSNEIQFKPWILKFAIGLDICVLISLIYVKAKADPSLLIISGAFMALAFVYERRFLAKKHQAS